MGIYRKYVKLRYAFLPYLYDLFYQGEQTGLPIMRPLVLHYEDDPNTHNLNGEFLVGENLLVAPVVEQGAVHKLVYLPEGRWYVADLIGCEVRDADTGKVYGVVTSVDHPGAQDIYTVKAPNGKEYLFPGVDAFLKERNPPEGYILVTPIPGLLDDDCDSEREE